MGFVWPAMMLSTVASRWTSYNLGDIRFLVAICRDYRPKLQNLPMIIHACSIVVTKGCLGVGTSNHDQWIPYIYAPDCSSWTRISRGSSLRDKLCALGDLPKQWVRNANLMISR